MKGGWRAFYPSRTCSALLLKRSSRDGLSLDIVMHNCLSTFLDLVQFLGLTWHLTLCEWPHEAATP
jgi:hypothetical protein